jgi:hypothetical protein
MTGFMVASVQMELQRGRRFDYYRFRIFFTLDALLRSSVGALLMFPEKLSPSSRA